VKIVRSISTRLRNRKRSVRPIARLIQEQYRAQPGNYLAFFSSYEYLNDVAGELTRTATDIDIWHQEPGMSESRRDEFLARFRPEGRGVGFAVLGGAFAEGVDLPGGRLIGAFVTTLGLPQVNPVNLEMQRRIETRFGAGYAYTFLIPGLRKVIQAAGRVIRTPTDAGVVYLIDDRFADPTVRRLLPAWWVVKDAASAPATKTVEVGLPR
jgi:Rad3-related DNA helicase